VKERIVPAVSSKFSGYEIVNDGSNVEVEIVKGNKKK